MNDSKGAPRFLIVDDEVASRTKMKVVLSQFGACEDADNGKDAVILFKSALEAGRPFSAIALDLSMPEMDGSQALNLIRRIEAQRNMPEQDRVKVIIVTASSDRDSLVSCVQLGCDDYLIKPFNRETMIQKVLKLGFSPLQKTADSAVAAPGRVKADPRTEKVDIGLEVMRRFAQGEMDLPGPSPVYSRFLELVKKDADIHEIADALKKDVGLTVVLIGVSNSVYYRGVEENKTLAQALHRLGLEETKKYVTLICNRELYRSKGGQSSTEMEQLWTHSLACAFACEIVSKKLGLDFSEDIFTMGLLHDVGKYLLMDFISELQEKGMVDAKSDYEEIAGIVKNNHGRFGSVLFENWGFSEIYTQCALYHDNPAEMVTIPTEILVVHFANILVKNLGYGQEKDEAIDIAGAVSTRRLGITESQMERIRQDLAERMEQAQNIMG